jgi:aspartyl-tRNA(Asn)/glutamyl-tRNA(Gln) amidotransferase subunit A
MTHDDLAFSDVVALQRLLTARTISSVELTELYLKRLEQHGHVFNAVVTILHDRARREAKRADAERARGRVRGPLHGIPYGVKDLLATPDAPTTWGAQPYRQQRFGFDATVVKKLTAAGAVLLAKLAMVELAGGFGYGAADASFTGPGRTPWNANFWSGGSSSGSGIAVSAALVGFAIGSETSGSILFPATACGITGLRPTYGRVSRHGAMALCWTLDKLGPMARSARDTDLILRVIAGADPADPTAVDAPFAPARRKLRVAVLKDATKASMPAVVANFRASLKAIGAFADVAGEVALPKGPWGPVVGTIVDAEGAAAFRDLIESGRARELRDPDDKLGGYVAYATPAVDYIDALRQRAKLNAALVKAMHGYDAVVSPTLPTVTYPIGLGFDKAYPKYPGGPSLISPGNLAGLPALALPNGMGPSGLPTSLTFLGHAWGEAALSALGIRYQRETAFHTLRPPMVPPVHA